MIKIMLVEDDKSLREIYGVRLLAEGYDIVSAGDGEAALAMAIKERPQLILSDVMMPKISGFDMLDILRSTTETKNIKVIMMTALSSDEQRLRGEQLGADRYLVKSQVGIEDVVHVVHDVLADAPQPAAPALAPVTSPQVPIPPQSSVTPERPQYSITTPQVPSNRNRVIQPLNDPRVASININELLDKELAKEAGVDLDARPTVATTEQEKAIIDSQIGQFGENITLRPQVAAPLESIPVVNVSTEGQLTQLNPPVSAPAITTASIVPIPVIAPAPIVSALPTPLTVPPRPVAPVIPTTPTPPPTTPTPIEPAPPIAQ